MVLLDGMDYSFIFRDVKKETKEGWEPLGLLL